MLISNKAIDNRITVALLALIIILAGGYSYWRLPREAAPDVPIPIVVVTTFYEGVSPEDIESSVTIISKISGSGKFSMLSDLFTPAMGLRRNT